MLAHERSGRTKTSIEILIYYPSTTPKLNLGLILGTDLPVVDEPCDGNLGFSAVRILTGLVRYSYRHSHSRPLHRTLQFDFTVGGTLPYHTRTLRGNDKLQMPNAK